MTMVIIELDVQYANHLCDGLGWYDGGTIYCLTEDGRIRDGSRLLGPPGMVSRSDVARIRFDRIVVVARGESVSMTVIDASSDSVDVLEPATEVRSVAIGPRCLTWLEQDGLDVGGRLYTRTDNGRVFGWGSVPWSNVEAVEGCARAVIGREGDTFYRNTRRGSAVVGVGDWRFDGRCSAELRVADGVIDLGCGGNVMQVSLPKSKFEEGYSFLDGFWADPVGYQLLLQVSPGVVIGAAVSRDDDSIWLEAHFTPGFEVPSRVVRTEAGVCVVWHSNDGGVVTGTWLTCSDDANGIRE